jgi:hypothetical protein
MVLTPEQKKHLDPKYAGFFPEGEPDQAWNEKYGIMPEYQEVRHSHDSNKIIDFYIYIYIVLKCLYYA